MRSHVASTFLAMLIATAMQPTASGNLSPDQKQQILVEAQQSYDAGIAVLRQEPAKAQEYFGVAAERFQIIVDSGVVNGHLYYNLANAYLQAGDIGHAILNYRNAARLIPHDARLQANLQYARTLVRSQIDPSSEQTLVRSLTSWHERIPLGWRYTALICANVLLWGALALMCLRVVVANGYVAGGLALLGLIWALLALSVVADWFGWGNTNAGVLVVDDVVVRKGNGLGFEPRYEQSLHSGVEFVVLEQRGEWRHIRLLNGDEGWIEAKSSELVQ